MHAAQASHAGRPGRWHQPGGQLLLAALVGLLCLLLWSQRAQWPLLQRLDRLLLDAQLQLRGPLQPQAPITLVAVDDRSLQALGRIVPDRAQLAQALAQLAPARPRALALDTLLLAPAADPADDEALAAAMTQLGTVLLPFALPAELEAGEQAIEPDEAVLRSAFTRYAGDATQLFQARTLRQPLPLLARAAAALGHVSVQRGVDGAVPFDLPVLAYEGELYPSLALRLAGASRGLDWAQARVQLGEAVMWQDLTLPLDALSRQWINYYGPAGRFEQISFIDLLEGRVPPERLHDRILLLGSTALGAGDAFPSPFDGGLPGVERLATAVDNLLSQRVLRHPPLAALMEMGLMLGLPLLVGLSLARLGLWRAYALQAVLLLALALALQWGLARHHVLDLGLPLLSLVLASLGAIFIRGLSEQARRRQALQALRESEQRYALAARGANDGLWDWDLVHGSVHFSPRCLALLGLAADEAQGIDTLGKPLAPAAREGLQAAIEAHLQGRSLQLHQVLQFEQGGQQRWLLLKGAAIREPRSGRALRMAGSLSDISEQQRLQQQLSHDALHDRLSGLPNRTAFRTQLAQMMSLAPGRRELGLLMLGLDEFRSFNEVHGPLAGDEVLRQLARRLREAEVMARAQGQGLLLARLSGDEFGLGFSGPLEPGGGAPGGWPVWALQQLAAPFEIGATPVAMGGDTQALPVQQVQLQACVGWAHQAQGPGEVDELLAAAESALARAKSQGPGHLHAFDAAEQLVEHSRRWMREQIERALQEGGQFQLHYQPFIRLSDRRLLGFEALLRWQHPERGLIMPGDFIPVAEASGQIAAIGRWTLLEAAAQLQRWAAQGFQGEIAVNVSGVQLEREDELLRDARDTLAALGAVPARQLKLEVTESMAMANPTRSAELLRQLSVMGFKLSIDDFGTGYSSLAYLHRFPFDTLKVDRSFVMRLAAGLEAQEIVRTIVGLALALGKQTLAEGVEDEAQAELLARLGVQVGQGWLFAKALPEAQATAWLARA